MNELTLEAYLKGLGFYDTSYGDELGSSMGIVSDSNDENRIQLFISEDDPLDREHEDISKYTLIVETATTTQTILETECPIDVWNISKHLELGLFKL
jgi:hypothetical protein